jgi:Ca2+-transporting ATPase
MMSRSFVIAEAARRMCSSVLLGFFQEYRASRALEALRQMAAPVARVLRDGVEAVVPARDLVPGDVVALRAGDRVPADTRLTEAANLAIDEAALTGESQPAQKSIDPFDDPQLPLGDRRNMTYAGTMVVLGRGRGVVASTGMSTEFGRIAGMVDSVEVARTAGDRRTGDGQAERARAAAARRRDSRQHIGHLLRQDRHVDQERDDRPADLR